MSVLSVPLKNDIAMQKDIFRLAAAIYSESNDVVSDAEIQLQIIKCMFVATRNDYLTKSEIISMVLEIYKYHISEDEVDNMLRKTKGVFQSVTKDESVKIIWTRNYERKKTGLKVSKQTFLNMELPEKQCRRKSRRKITHSKKANAQYNNKMRK